MSEMIERVARAIVDAYCGRAVNAPHVEDITVADREAARAAIEAMREPTEAMISEADSAGYHVTCNRQFVRREIEREWRAMIDAAPGEEK